VGLALELLFKIISEVYKVPFSFPWEEGSLSSLLGKNIKVEISEKKIKILKKGVGKNIKL